MYGRKHLRSAGLHLSAVLVAIIRSVFMKNLYRTLLLTALFVMPLAGALLAQPGSGGNPPCWPPPCIPIDGGLSLLIGAGALLGSKKALDARKARKSAV